MPAVGFVSIDNFISLGDHPMFKAGLRISLISIAVAAVAIPLSAAVWIGLALIGF